MQVALREGNLDVLRLECGEGGEVQLAAEGARSIVQTLR